MRVQADHYHARLWAAVAPHLSGRERVLEVGCGSGEDARRLVAAGHQVVAVDVEAHPGWDRERPPGLTFLEASAERLPFEDGQYDAAIERDALHHMREPGRAVRELRRVLGPGGLAVVVEANRYNPLFYAHMTRLHGHDHFSGPYLRGLLDGAFDEVEIRMLETRAYPFVADALMPAVRFWERGVERAPGLRRMAAYAVAVCRVGGSDRPVSREAVFRGGLLPALARRGLGVHFHRRA